jgi:hypothetical protein
MTGIVAEYQEKFLALLGHIEALPMPQQVSIFTTALIDLLKSTWSCIIRKTWTRQ